MANQNPRVSLEEMRAKRLAREQQESMQQGTQETAEPQLTQNDTSITVSQSGIEQAAMPAPIPAPAPAPVLPNLDDLLANMDAAQLARIRTIAAAKGLAVPAAGDGAKSADGSLTLTIHLDPQVTEQLEIWAEADSCTLVEEAQRRITEALSNYLYGDWNPVMEPQPAPVAVVRSRNQGSTGYGE